MPVPRWRAALEIAALIVITLAVAGHMLDFAPSLRPPGVEFPYLINPGAVAADIWAEFGTLPLWNPLIGRGEQMFESLFSFLLNPFMTLPILALGAVDGAKVAIVLHGAIAAVGGWALARTLGLGWVSRVLLGLLMLGAGNVIVSNARGFYQLALSLCYMPWVYAGLFAVLRARTRAAVGLLVVSTLMMMFAGTFWFLLPTAFGCAVFALAELAAAAPRGGWRRLGERVRPLVISGGFIIGLGLLYLLPRVNTSTVFHLTTGLGEETQDFFALVRSYVEPALLAQGDFWFGYHYMVPVAFVLAAALAAAVALTWRRAGLSVSLTPRLFIPALLVLGVFLVWAQGNTPVFRWLYEHTPLNQWRSTLRVLAAGAPIVGLLVAAALDDVVQRAKARAAWAGYAAMAVAAVGGGWAGLEVVQRNWGLIQLQTMPEYALYAEALRLARTLSGDTLVSVQTDGLLNEMDFYTWRLRSSIGNPDVFTIGLPSQVGPDALGHVPGNFGLGYTPGYLEQHLPFLGFQPVPGAPLTDYGPPVLWANPNAMPYAFIAETEAVRGATALFSPAYVQAASYVHHWDAIDVMLPPFTAPSVVVVNEAPYPGWAVQVDGRSVPMESIGGLLGVQVEPGAAHVAFSYNAPLFTVGAVVSGVVLIGFCGYLLRLPAAGGCAVAGAAPDDPAGQGGADAAAPDGQSVRVSGT